MSTEPARTLKVVVCGDVNGKFDSLFKRISSIQTKMGSFDMMFCVGNFFGDDMSQWTPYKTGEKTVPVTMYILGANEDSHAQYFMNDEGEDLCENVTYLGRKGLFTSTSGLTVAYLSGRDGGDKSDFTHFSKSDVAMVCEKITSGASRFTGVDILLTSPWPHNVSQYGTQLKQQPKDDSRNVANMAAILKPRYHFSGLEGVSYDRNPYRNHKLLVGSQQHVSRFSALAEVGNKEKAKFMYAFNIVPMKYIEKSELYKQPVDTTECPYKQQVPEVKEDRADPTRNEFFYGEGPRKRAGPGDGGPDSKREPPKPKGPCWFCLGSAEVEKHLVVSVGDHVYMALPKGGLDPHHVLILPIGHFQSLVTCSDEVLEEIEKYKAALGKFYKTQGKVPLFFERNFKSSHTQLQTVAVDKSVAENCMTVFMEKAEEQGINLVEIPERSELKQITEPGKTYFYAELPSGEKLFHRIQKAFPIQFGRDVLADQRLLNKPGAVDWRNCTQDKETETKMAKRFQKEFRKYDFNAL